VSADEFFMHGGRYEFDRSKLANAHGACRRAFRAAIERGDPVIVVDNTNIRHEEYAEYVKIAKEAGYDVIIDVVETDLSSEELAKRDVHAVPVEVIEHMRQRWQP
jgi:predicted kinase